MIPPAPVKGRVSARVKVRDLDGTIIWSFGHPDHPAHEVLLDDVGSTQLFWYYQLRDEPPGESRSSTMHRIAY